MSFRLITHLLLTFTVLESGFILVVSLAFFQSVRVLFPYSITWYLFRQIFLHITDFFWFQIHQQIVPIHCMTSSFTLLMELHQPANPDVKDCPIFTSEISQIREESGHETNACKTLSTSVVQTGQHRFSVTCLVARASIVGRGPSHALQKKLRTFGGRINRNSLLHTSLSMLLLVPSCGD